METEHWIWLEHGLKGDYPNWRQIILHPNSLVRAVSFLPERGEQLAVFLRNVPAQEPHNPVEQYQSEDPGSLNILAGEMHTSIAADFTRRLERFFHQAQSENASPHVVGGTYES